ncbi:hypothetical protein AXX17_AT1G31760 [Arabidopsis thaliana]|uniref:F-box associated beta-propeller type 3 domain-containing protein n=1 Tax=Arabidopsis thaliana TaxID=3702 RepID=A0A178W3K1_ARATH|nr:hypothetical protein AXX17_AT1G31760 [Arabidopsis thaliana]
MNGGKYIPIDLFLAIFSSLPAKVNSQVSLRVEVMGIHASPSIFHGVVLDESEKFKFEGAENCHYQLINYKGKLCEIYVEYARDVGFPLKLIMRVLEDVDKQEWSKDVYSLYSERKFGHDLSAIDYVEDISVNIAMQIKSSPLQQSRNIVTKKPKPQQRPHTSRDLCKSCAVCEETSSITSMNH